MDLRICQKVLWPMTSVSFTRFWQSCDLRRSALISTVGYTADSVWFGFDWITFGGGYLAYWSKFATWCIVSKGHIWMCMLKKPESNSMFSPVCQISGQKKRYWKMTWNIAFCPTLGNPIGDVYHIWPQTPQQPAGQSQKCIALLLVEQLSPDASNSPQWLVVWWKSHHEIFLHYLLTRSSGGLDLRELTMFYDP